MITHMHEHARTHTHTHSLSLSLSHRHTHTYTHTHTHNDSPDGAEGTAANTRPVMGSWLLITTPPLLLELGLLMSSAV